MSLNTNPDSPRQKMINLMYIVLMAMLALNVSSDVLNGFSLVDESLSRTTANSTVPSPSGRTDGWLIGTRTATACADSS